jgi:hypothetical protein
MIRIDPVGECRELREVMELGHAFRARHQIALGLPPHLVARLIEFPESSFLALAIVHSLALSLSGSHRPLGRRTVGWMGALHHTTSDGDP